MVITNLNGEKQGPLDPTEDKAHARVALILATLEVE